MNAKCCDWCKNFYLVDSSEDYSLLNRESEQVDLCPGCIKEIVLLRERRLADKRETKTFFKVEDEEVLEVKEESKTRSKSWTGWSEEDTNFIESMSKKGKMDYTVLQKKFPGRTSTSLRQKVFKLGLANSSMGRKMKESKIPKKDNVKKGASSIWTVEQDNIIKNMSDEGKMDYELLMEKLPDRTLTAIRWRVSSLGCSSTVRMRGITGESDEEYMSKIRSEESEKEDGVCLYCGDRVEDGAELCLECQKFDKK